MDSRTINLYIVTSYKFLFLFFGAIGNVLFIHLTFKRKSLQTRTSALQCVQCIFHIICQIGTMFDGNITLGNHLNREECYQIIAFYVFFQSAQSVIMVVIVLDILLFVKFPTIYRNISKSQYIFVTSFPVITCSILITVYGYTATNEDWIPSCTPGFAFTIEASRIYKYFILTMSVVVTVIYAVLIRTFYLKGHHENSSSLKTMKRLQFSVGIFIFTWFFSQIFGLIILQMTEYTAFEASLFVHNSLFTSLAYSNTFYVAMWRSKEYREHFYSVWWPKKVQTSSAIVLHTNFILHKSSTMDFSASRLNGSY